MLRFTKVGFIDVVKAYVINKKTKDVIGVAVDGKVYQNGLELDMERYPDIEIKQQRISENKTLTCYRFNPDTSELHETNSRYEIKERGRYHSIVLDEKNTPKLALLCLVNVSLTSGLFTVYRNPFEGDNPADYIDNENYLKRWVIFDEYYF